MFLEGRSSGGSCSSLHVLAADCQPRRVALAGAWMREPRSANPGQPIQGSPDAQCPLLPSLVHVMPPQALSLGNIVQHEAVAAKLEKKLNHPIGVKHSSTSVARLAVVTLPDYRGIKHTLCTFFASSLVMLFINNRASGKADGSMKGCCACFRVCSRRRTDDLRQEAERACTVNYCFHQCYKPEACSLSK